MPSVTRTGEETLRVLDPVWSDSEQRARAQLAAIVEGSDDAILTKNLDGIITSWNRGAERLFGYTAAEAVGRPVTLLIPHDRHSEETEILARLRRGERIEHYETIRRRKDGQQLHISLTVSPLRDEDGVIVGASKIARNITDRVRAQEQQRLLLAEMQHRIKNVFAVANGLIRLCAARAETPAQLAEMAQARLQALAHAHALTVRTPGDDNPLSATATLSGLLATLAAPAVGDSDARVTLHGEDLSLPASMVTPLALVLNELMTNAAKHGALRDETGSIAVEARHRGDLVVLTWRERGDDLPSSGPVASGFGTQLSQITVEHQLGGSIVREWGEDGLTVTITFGAGQLQ